MRLALDDVFRCTALRCTLTVRCCLARQAASRRQRNHTNRNRGQGSSYPSCTDACAQGAELRRTVPGALAITWRGSGPGGRFEREQSGRGAAQARQRLAAVGLLDEMPTIDAGPGRRDAGPQDPYAEAALLTPDDRGTAHQG